MDESIRTQFTRPIQVGLVVRDLDVTAQKIRDLLGMEPTAILETKSRCSQDKDQSGEDAGFQLKVALYKFPGMEMEYIQPIRGKSIWQDFLNSHGEGLHHIAFDVNSHEGAMADMKGKSIPLLIEGPSVRNPKLHWSYFDTEEQLGFILETINFSEIENSTGP